MLQLSAKRLACPGTARGRCASAILLNAKNAKIIKSQEKKNAKR